MGLAQSSLCVPWVRRSQNESWWQLQLLRAWWGARYHPAVGIGWWLPWNSTKTLAKGAGKKFEAPRSFPRSPREKRWVNSLVLLLLVKIWEVVALQGEEWRATSHCLTWSWETKNHSPWAAVVTDWIGACCPAQGLCRTKPTFPTDTWRIVIFWCLT